MEHDRFLLAIEGKLTCGFDERPSNPLSLRVRPDAEHPKVGGVRRERWVIADSSFVNLDRHGTYDSAAIPSDKNWDAQCAARYVFDAAEILDPARIAHSSEFSESIRCRLASCIEVRWLNPADTYLDHGRPTPRLGNLIDVTSRLEGLASVDDLALEDLRQRRLNVLRGDVSLPVLIVMESALNNNIGTMARYCESHHVSLAPHFKTTMAPTIAERQLKAGAWAITAASINQVKVLRAHGVNRVILANEVVDPAGLCWIARELRSSEHFELMCLADSVEGSEIMSRVLEREGFDGQVPVLIEVGVQGGRAGCRSVDEAISVAAALRDSAVLRLVGIEGFEAVVEHLEPPSVLTAVDEFLRRMRAVATSLAEERLLDDVEEIIVSAGGSTYFERVVALLTDWTLGTPVRTVLRCGAYVLHEAGSRASMSPLGGPGHGGLRPALEIWAPVLSRPEPDLAILGFGKRDAPCDESPPIAKFAVSGHNPLRDIEGKLEITGLNDQHAYARLRSCTLAVGDLVGCHLGYPGFPAFKKWRFVPLVDDNYNVLASIRTYS